MGKRPLSFGELIGSGQALAALTREAARREDLAAWLRDGLPSALHGAITGCSLRPDGTLLVSVPSAEWAARLRFESLALLTRCRARHPATAQVRIRVGAA